MASLYFKYGTMGSGKSFQLQVIAYNYEESGKRVLTFKAAQDNRSGEDVIYSRVGLSRKAIPVYMDTNIFQAVYYDMCMTKKGLDAVLIDEAQFLTEAHIGELQSIVDELGIPVMAFGLKNDYRNELFTGSKRLLILADNIEEFKTMCRDCNRKATMVALFENGKRKFNGEQIIIDNDVNRKSYRYVPVCRSCYYNPFLAETLLEKEQLNEY